jgi:hypothetical protein
MDAEGESNFFSRWSRRKVQVRTGQPLAEVPPAVAPVVVAAPLAPQASGVRAPAAPTLAPAPSKPSAELAEEPAPALTLDDVARLTTEGDFKPFMARQVPAEVRNAAVKKLFTDPHFNVMDGLDIYIDDYSKPSPLSAADMARMVGAQFLKLVDDPNEVKPAVPTPDSPTPDNPTATAPDSADEPTSATTPQASDETPDEAPTHPSEQESAPDTPEPHHDHADLQLQPDHAPERPGPGTGAG